MSEILDSSLLLTVGCCASVSIKPGFDICRDGRYPYCLIHYIYSGVMHIDYASEHYTVHPGEIFLLPAYSHHHYYAHHSGRVLWAEFYGVNSQAVFETVIRQNGLVVGTQVSASLLRDLQALLDVYKDPYNASLTVFQLLMDLMEGTRLRPAGKTVLQQSLQYIQTHLAEKLDIERLAGLCGYSSSYFSRLFHRTYGVTVSQYISHKRLESAKCLLEQPNLSISQIAESVGFSDSSHFIKSFRDTYGETPGVFRRHLSMYLGRSFDV